MIFLFFNSVAFADRCEEIAGKIGSDTHQATTKDFSTFPWANISWLQNNLNKPTNSSALLTEIYYWPNNIILKFENGQKTFSIGNGIPKELFNNMDASSSDYIKALGAPKKVVSQKYMKYTWDCRIGSGSGITATIRDNDRVLISLDGMYCTHYNGSDCDSMSGFYAKINDDPSVKIDY